VPSQVTPHVGAMGEMAASAYLLQKGYLAFRNVSPHGPFDLVAYRDGTLDRVEVKASTRNNRTGRRYFSWPVNDEWDRLIVIDAESMTCALDLYHDDAISWRADNGGTCLDWGNNG